MPEHGRTRPQSSGRLRQPYAPNASIAHHIHTLLHRSAAIISGVLPGTRIARSCSDMALLSS